nr:UBA-like, GBF-interacting protein 1 [Tanacetum cinerariifolium]
MNGADLYWQIGYQYWRGASQGIFRSSKVFNGKHSSSLEYGKLDLAFASVDYAHGHFNARGRRNFSSGREYGVSNHVKVFRPKLPVDSRKESNVGHMATCASNVNGTLAIPNGSHSHKLATKPSSEGDRQVQLPELS